MAQANITTQNLVPAGAATEGSAVTIEMLGRPLLGIQVSGTYTGALSLQGTLDGQVWVTLGGNRIRNVNTGAGSSTISSGSTGIFEAEVNGFYKVRVTGLAAMTGTAGILISAFASPVPSVNNQLPATLGPQTLPNSLSVTPASSGTATATQVASSVTAVTLLAANTGRNGATIFYDGGAVLYLLEGSGTPTSSNYTGKLGAGLANYYECQPGFTGIIKGIWSVAVGSANITERTA